MSLLDELAETCTMIDRTTAPDGYGGVIETWVDGATFTATIGLDDSVQAQTALAMGAKGVYTVVTKKSVNLRYHDVFRRSDGKVLRVVTDGDDKKTPPSAMNMRVVKAEEWAVTSNE